MQTMPLRGFFFPEQNTFEIFHKLKNQTKSYFAICQIMLDFDFNLAKVVLEWL